MNVAIGAQSRRRRALIAEAEDFESGETIAFSGSRMYSVRHSSEPIQPKPCLIKTAKLAPSQYLFPAHATLLLLSKRGEVTPQRGDYLIANSGAIRYDAFSRVHICLGTVAIIQGTIHRVAAASSRIPDLRERPDIAGLVVSIEGIREVWLTSPLGCGCHGGYTPFFGTWHPSTCLRDLLKGSPSACGCSHCRIIHPSSNSAALGMANCMLACSSRNLYPGRRSAGHMRSLSQSKQ
jgi:hypothetical protein